MRVVTVKAHPTFVAIMREPELKRVDVLLHQYA
jgi:hypothetical protein